MQLSVLPTYLIRINVRVSEVLSTDCYWNRSANLLNVLPGIILHIWTDFDETSFAFLRGRCHGDSVVVSFKIYVEKGYTKIRTHFFNRIYVTLFV